MLITPALPSDIPTLVRLVNDAYRGEGGWTQESHLLKGARTDAAGVAQLMEDPGAVILKCVDGEGVLTGCVHLQKRGPALYLGMLSVAPACQGAGIGKALLEAAVAHGRQNQCARIHITVISVRHELIAWYERHGYVRTGEMEPFHAGEKFGVQLQPLELVVLERGLEENL